MVMYAQTEDTNLNSEDGMIEKLLRISSNNVRPIHEHSLCLACGKSQNQLALQRDLKRWSTGREVGTGSVSDLWSGRSFCDCKNETEYHGKSQSFKFKKRQLMDNNKVGRSTSVKNFITHNKLLCNGVRSKHNIPDQMIHQFIHHKNKTSYIDKYRKNKIKKLEEQSCFQLDQSSFDNELFASLSKSLSSIITEKPAEAQPAVTHVDSIGHQIQSRLKLADSQSCRSPFSSLQTESGLINQQRNRYLSSLDICMRCGDNGKNTNKQGTNATQLEATRTSMLIQEKIEEKKAKKLSKRFSGQRSKLIAEKNPIDLTKPMIESSTSSSLQPVCHQIPIRNNIFTEKHSPLKKDEWKGHPSSVRPTFSERPARGADARRKPDGSFVKSLGKTLEYADVFNTYGDKYIKETI